MEVHHLHKDIHYYIVEYWQTCHKRVRGCNKLLEMYLVPFYELSGKHDGMK